MPRKQKNKFTDNVNECRICGDEFQNNQYVLKCGHQFHYDCLIYAYNSPTKKTCPYCRKNNGYLSLQLNMIAIKGIHKEYSAKQCNGIYKYGVKKGTQCIHQKKENSDYCGRHIKNLSP